MERQTRRGGVASVAGDDAGATVARAGMHDLPDDMRAIVHSYLSARDLVALAGTSRLENAHDGGIWHRLLTIDFGMPADAFQGQFVRDPCQYPPFCRAGSALSVHRRADRPVRCRGGGHTAFLLSPSRKGAPMMI